MAIRTVTVYFADEDTQQFTGENVEMRLMSNDLIVVKTDPYESFFFAFGTWRYANLREGVQQNDSEGQPIGPDEDVDGDGDQQSGEPPESGPDDAAVAINIEVGRGVQSALSGD